MIQIQSQRKSLTESVELVSGRFRQFKDFVKHRRLVNRQFRQGFTIQTKVGLFETMNEFRVIHTTHLAGGRDTRDPETPHLTFERPTIAEGVHPGFQDGFLNCSQQLAPSAEVSFGFLEKSFFLATPSRSDGDTHGLLLCLMKVWGMGIRAGRKLPTGLDTFTDVLGESARHDSVIAELTNFFTAFVAHDVATKSAPMDRFSGRGNFEPLLHSLVCFLFRHSF